MNSVDERYEQQLADRIDYVIDSILDGQENMLLAAGGASGQTGGAAKEFQTVGPEARHKLKGILQHYAKETHPFTACVRDNAKRFGPERADRVCAVVKDIIFNTTKWRGKGNPAGVGPHPYTGLAEWDPPVVNNPTGPIYTQSDVSNFFDEEVASLLDKMAESEFPEISGRSMYEYMQGLSEDELKEIHFKDYSIEQRKALAAKGYAQPDLSFPVVDKNDLHNAIVSLGRANNPGAAKAHIIKRARALGATDMLPKEWNING